MRTFTAATDEVLAEMVRGARKRLVFIAPGVTQKVAQALGERFRDPSALVVTVILDANPEVYRLGYGTIEGLSLLRRYADRYGESLRFQRDVRIGVVVADDQTLVYAPTAQLIEEGPSTPESPNALLFSGATSSAIAEAAGAADKALPMNGEIGHQALTPQQIEEVEQDLKRTPPTPFDLARQAKVFSSKLQYVELEVSNYKFSTKEAPIPPELLGLADDQELKQRWRSSVRVLSADDLKIQLPMTSEGVAPVGSTNQKCLFEPASGPNSNHIKLVAVDQEYLERERKKIENEFLITVPHYGAVLFRNKQAEFEQRVKAFSELLDAYHQVLMKQINGKLAQAAQHITGYLAPRVLKRPPASYRLYTSSPSDEDITKQLEADIHEALSTSALFPKPQVRYVFKDIAYQTFTNDEFRRALHAAFKRKRVPENVINGIFQESLAVIEKRVHKGV